MTISSSSMFGRLFLTLALLVALMIAGCSSERVTQSTETLNPATATEGSLRLDVLTRPGSPCPTTTITFDLPQASHVFLEVTNATGYCVKVLFDGPIEAGTHQVDWDATNESGEAIDPGIYLFHLQASEYEKWHPMIMVL